MGATYLDTQPYLVQLGSTIILCSLNHFILIKYIKWKSF